MMRGTNATQGMLSNVVVGVVGALLMARRFGPTRCDGICARHWLAFQT